MRKWENGCAAPSMAPGMGGSLVVSVRMGSITGTQHWPRASIVQWVLKGAGGKAPTRETTTYLL